MLKLLVMMMRKLMPMFMPTGQPLGCGCSRSSSVVLTPPADADLGGQVFDVRSGSAERAPDGSLYADW